MARQRIRAEMTWKAARARHKALVEKLAKSFISAAGTTSAFNSAENWQDVGKYHLLNDTLDICASCEQTYPYHKKGCNGFSTKK